MNIAIQFIFIFAVMITPVQALKAVLARLSAASTVFDDADTRAAAIWACALEQDGLDRISNLTYRWPTNPVLNAYSSDGSSFLVRAQVDHAGPVDNIQRRGRLLQEYLSQRVLIKAQNPAHGGMDMETYMPMPLPMNDGKTAENHFVAATRFWPHIQDPDAERIVVNHTCFDRAIQSSLSRLLTQEMDAWFDPEIGPQRNADSYLAALKSWNTHVGCVAHDISGGLRWGQMHMMFPTVTKDLYVSVESCRNTFAQLYSFLILFFTQYLSFDRVVDETMEQYWWTMMGIPTTWIEDYILVAPRWLDNTLHVRSGLQNTTDGLENISAVFIHCMQWKRFTETRWLTVGASCRRLMCSIAMGLDGLFTVTRAGGNYEYYAHGWDRCTDTTRKFAATCAVGSWPVESILAEVLHDDRLGRNVEEIDAKLKEELLWIESVPFEIWERLAELTPSWDAVQLRDSTLKSAHTSSAYVYKLSIDAAMGLPWKLGRGDVLKNLHGLVLGEKPSDEISGQIKELLERGS